MNQLSTPAKIVNHDKRPSMKNHELVRSFGAFEIQKIGRKYIHTLSLAPNTNPNYITYLIINPLCSSLKVGDLALCEVVDRSEKINSGLLLFWSQYDFLASKVMGLIASIT